MVGYIWIKWILDGGDAFFFFHLGYIQWDGGGFMAFYLMG